MNFDFDLNQIVPYCITQFDNNFKIIHPSNLPSEEWADQLDWNKRKKLALIIDRMGEASSKAQGLRDVITSSQRFQLSEQHCVYLMKDSLSNSGYGSIVGMLKVGRKHLFIHDLMGKNHEMKPLCILDFFVNESIQRRGYGKKLFDFMLQMEQVDPAHCAVDKPSEKSVKFLKKHYNLRNPIIQVNNFVVFEGFFKNRFNENDYVRNKRNNRDNFDSLRKFSAEPSYNRSNMSSIGFENKNFLSRTGSVGSRYNNDRNDHKTIGYIPDFNKGSKASSLKQIDQNQYISNSTNINSNSNNQYIDQSYDNFESKLKTIDIKNKFMNNDSTHRSAPNDQSNYQISVNKQYFFNNIHQQQLYQPFPSLNKNSVLNNNDSISSISTFPSRTVINNQNTFQSHSIAPTCNQRNIQSDINNIDVNTLNRSTTANFMQPSIHAPNANNRYDPFPSLSTMKTVPEFYSMQGSNYRKTRLW